MLRYGGGAALSIALCATPVFAQGPAQATLRPRSGTEAQAPAVPPYATPAPPLETAPPLSVSDASGVIRLKDVYVGYDQISAPLPKPRWKPMPDGATGLSLVYRSGERLDAAWVKRQFGANGLIGRDVPYGRIAALVQLISLAYVNNGFLNSGVLIQRQQLDADGILRLQLVLGKLAAPAADHKPIAVTWKDGHARGLSEAFIRNRLPSASDIPLDLQAVERDFRLLADDAAIRTVNANILPGAHPGEANLVASVDPASRFDAYAGVANSRSPSVGGERASVGGSLRNLLNPGDRINAEFGSTSGVTDFTAGYATSLLGPSGGFSINGGFNNAAVIDRPLVPLDIRSREWYIEGGPTLRVIARPLLPGSEPGTWYPAENATIGLLVVHRRVISTLFGERFSFSPGAEDGRTEYSALRFIGNFTRRSPKTVLALAVTATVGLDGTRSDDGPVTPSTGFSALLLQANYAHRLDSHQLELRLRFAGQASSGVLYSPERFALGGADTVRGYRESLLLADEAAVASVELARPVHIGGAPNEDFDLGAFTLAGYLDGALAHNRAPPQPAPHGIAAVGLEIDWSPLPGFLANLTYGHALKHVQAPGDRDIQDRGIEFRIVLHPIDALKALRK